MKLRFWFCRGDGPFRCFVVEVLVELFAACQMRGYGVSWLPISSCTLWNLRLYCATRALGGDGNVFVGSPALAYALQLFLAQPCRRVSSKFFLDFPLNPAYWGTLPRGVQVLAARWRSRITIEKGASPELSWIGGAAGSPLLPSIAACRFLSFWNGRFRSTTAMERNGLTLVLVTLGNHSPCILVWFVTSVVRVVRFDLLFGVRFVTCGVEWF